MHDLGEHLIGCQGCGPPREPLPAAEVTQEVLSLEERPARGQVRAPHVRTRIVPVRGDVRARELVECRGKDRGARELEHEADGGRGLRDGVCKRGVAGWRART